MKISKIYFLLILLTFMACSQEIVNKKPEISTAQPNILLIVADDLGYYDLSITGSRYYETPNLDMLARESIQFTHAYSTSPVCSPARASIMTGQFPSRHGITDWIGAKTGEDWREKGRHTKMLPPQNNEMLSRDHFTLAEAMKEAGYSTFIAGKWHLGGDDSTPEDHGFDINVGAWKAGSPVGGYFDPYDNPELPNRKPGEALSKRLARETIDYFQQMISANQNKPFFAYLPFYAVHGPLQTSHEKWEKYRDKADSLGIAAHGFEMGQYLPVRTVQDHPVYAGMVEMMDQATGHVLDALKSLDLDENTIVIFTSDHGGVSSGDQYATTNLPFRAGKGSTFEGGLRVPFFIKVPKMKPNGRISETPITGADIYPTVLELIDQPLIPNQHADGESIVPLLRGDMIEDRALYWHYPHYSNQDGRPSGVIRKGHWKLIYDYQTNEKELYKIVTDDSESRNIANQYPDVTESLYRDLANHLEHTDALFPIPDPEYDPSKEKKWLEFSRTNRMQHLENQRLDFLSPDYNPENNWWGSDVDQ